MSPLCAKLPIFAPVLSASTAFLLSESLLMPDTLNTDAEYGCLQSGPPTITRAQAQSGCAGASR